MEQRAIIIALEPYANGISAVLMLILVAQSAASVFVPAMGIVFTTPVVTFAANVAALFVKHPSRAISVACTIVVFLCQILAWKWNPERKLHYFTTSFSFVQFMVYLSWVFAVNSFALPVVIHYQVAVLTFACIVTDLWKAYSMQGVITYDQSGSTLAAVAIACVSAYAQPLASAGHKPNSRQEQQLVWLCVLLELVPLFLSIFADVDATWIDVGLCATCVALCVVRAVIPRAFVNNPAAAASSSS